MKYLGYFSILLITFLSFACKENKPQTEISRVPTWASEAVWYQIFPERFYNGDKKNDPKPIDLQGAWPYKTLDGWQVSSWTSNWYKRNPWEENEHDFYWNMGTRRYGGDLQGVLNKLDYLQELGITAIYFNPIFETPSLHKYDASMYHHIDNNFGPNPELDRKMWSEENPGDASTWKWTTADSLFLKLVKEIHKRDMKIIIDGVFNHVGTTFWAFKDLVKNQENSPYKDWFDVVKFDNPKTPENEFDYNGWIGIKDLPEFKEDENGLLPPIRKHVFDVVKRWMDPNGDGNPEDGIDGWRLDVAEMVNINFWKKFRTYVKSINPNAYITGEIWWEDWQNNKMMNASPWLQGDTFDAVMNYRFTRALKNFVSDQKTQINATAFWDSLANQYRDYNKENLYVLMNLLGSHDTERLASMIVNPDIWYDHWGNPGQDKNWNVRKPNEVERKRQKLMVGIQMLLPGAPMIYYGDEAGMWGGDDPDDRKPMVWKELKYDDEVSHPFGKKRPIDKVVFDEDLFEWYKKIIAIRKSDLAFSKGDLKSVIIPNENKLLVFYRFSNSSKFLVIANNSDFEKDLDLSVYAEQNQNFINYLNENETVNLKNIKMKPYAIEILKVVEK